MKLRPSRPRGVRLLSFGLFAALAAILLSVPSPAVAQGYGDTVAVCVTNTLDETISYEYRWGTGPWSWDVLEPGAEVEHRLELDPREGVVPWLQVRYRRQYPGRGMRTIGRATPVTDGLECKPLFAELDPEALTELREDNLQSANDRWQEAAAGADRELSSATDLYFDVPRKDRSVVRVWKQGEPRPVVLGRISELRPGRRPSPVSLWGEGRYLVEIFDDVEVALVESFVLDAKDLPEVTRIVPRVVSP